MLQQQTEEKTSTTKFKLANMTVIVENLEQVQRKQNSMTETEEFINLPSLCSNNVIKKTFELRFGHHTITFQDTIRIQDGSNIQSQCPTSVIKNITKNTKQHNKKLVLFRNKISNGNFQAKGDKKNIAKNVVMAFANSLKDCKREGQNFEGQIQSLKLMIDKKKFNNQLIAHIIDNYELRDLFHRFLSTFAMPWISHSKLKNKQIHEQAIQLYEKLCIEAESVELIQKQKESEQQEIQQDDNEYYFQSGINHQLEDEIKEFK